MNPNDLNNKLAEYEARIKALEAKIQDYYTEQRDDTYRNDMQADGKIDKQPISREMAIQQIKSFYQNYDKQHRQNIEDLRTRDPTNPEIAKYDKLSQTIKDLQTRFNL